MVNIAAFAEDSDLHGIKQLTRRENGWVRRVIWALMLVTSLTFLVKTTANQVIYFLQYDHTTKYDMFFVHELEFPAITICNVNKHRRTAFTKVDIAVMGPHLEFTDEHYNLHHADIYPQDWYNKTFLGTNWTEIKQSVIEDDYDLMDFYDRSGHQYEDLVQHCSWKGRSCDPSSWSVEFTHYGKCYTFNRHGNHTLIKAGAGNGLLLMLYVEEDEYIEMHGAQDLGIKFMPHTHIEPPFLKEQGYGAAPGYHYLIGLKEKSVIGLPQPYGDCELDHETKYYKNYTVPGCRIECETERIVEECNCRLVESPGNHPVCTLHQLECAEEVIEALEQSDSCPCHNPCHAIQYPYAMSMLKNRESTVEKLMSSHDESTLLNKENVIVLNIYFDSLSFEAIVQYPAYTWESIVSDFGGTMGLWLGASILAAFQLVDYCLMMCSNCCCTRKLEDEEGKADDIDVAVWKSKQGVI